MRLEFARQVRNQPTLNQVGITGVSTVTYGQNHPKDSITLRTHIHNFTRRLKRDGIGGYYMIEFQEERRVVHVHFILTRWVDHHEWATMWGECSDQKGDIDVYNVHAYRHPGFPHRHMTQKLRSARGAGYYAAKYASKAGLQKTIPEGFEWSGRWWGKFGMPPVKPITKEETSSTEHVQIRRLLRRKSKSDANGYYKARVIGELNAIARKNELHDGFGLPEGKAWKSARQTQESSAVWSILHHNGRVCMGWEGVDRAIRRGMASEGIRPPKKGKDWDKLTCYGQGAFLLAHYDRLKASWTPKAVSIVVALFGAKVVDRTTPESRS